MSALSDLPGARGRGNSPRLCQGRFGNQGKFLHGRSGQALEQAEQGRNQTQIFSQFKALPALGTCEGSDPAGSPQNMIPKNSCHHSQQLSLMKREGTGSKDTETGAPTQGIYPGSDNKQQMKLIFNKILCGAKKKPQYSQDKVLPVGSSWHQAMPCASGREFRGFSSTHIKLSRYLRLS